MDKSKFTGYNGDLKQSTRDLRKEMTPQERHLWYNFLRDYPVRIYRQRSIDRFIADFYCSKARLVIELDGSQHYTPEGMDYDEWRSGILKKYNLDVLRIGNLDVDRNFRAVCEYIDQVIQARLPEELRRKEF